MPVANQALDDDLRAARIQTKADWLGGIAKAKLSNGNWIAGALSLLLIGALLSLGLMRESWTRSLQQQTCNGVLTSGLDKDKLAFLDKNCVAK